MTRPSGPPVDGRTARRDRNRDAVLDAVHELFVEGHVVPGVDAVAERSGVSLRSIYRYFPDTQQLLQAALLRRTTMVEPLWQLAGVGVGSLDDRVARFVDHRLDIYQLTAPTIRAAFELAGSLPAISEQIEHRKQQLRDQAAAHFAAELDTLGPGRAPEVLATLEVLTQFESLELLVVQRELPVDAARQLLTRAVRAVLVHG